MEEKIYYLCVEYKNLKKNQFGKSYVSFNEIGELNYDNLNLYTLEEIDEFLKKNSSKSIISQMQQDNIFYFLQNDNENTSFELSIRFYQNGKERSISPLSEESKSFNTEEFIYDLNPNDKKIIYNSLGGYLNNSHVTKEMKEWIKALRTTENIELLNEYKKLSYVERRKIKEIIYLLFHETKQPIKENSLIRKKVQDKVAA